MRIFVKAQGNHLKNTDYATFAMQWTFILNGNSDKPNIYNTIEPKWQHDIISDNLQRESL